MYVYVPTQTHIHLVVKRISKSKVQCMCVVHLPIKVQNAYMYVQVHIMCICTQTHTNSCIHACIYTYLLQIEIHACVIHKYRICIRHAKYIHNSTTTSSCNYWTVYAISYVTGFWKTNQIVTLGLFLFIGQTNGYIRTLHIHSVSIRLG